MLRNSSDLGLVPSSLAFKAGLFVCILKLGYVDAVRSARVRQRTGAGAVAPAGHGAPEDEDDYRTLDEECQKGLQCSDLKRRLQKNERCHRGYEHSMECTPGTGWEPDPTLFYMWKLGDTCDSVYTFRKCYVIVGPGLYWRMTSRHCPDVVLGVQDCNDVVRVSDELIELNPGKDKNASINAKGAEVAKNLAVLLLSLKHRDHSKWIKVPSLRQAIPTLGKTLNQLLKMPSGFRDTDQLGVIWQALLAYCESSEQMLEGEGDSDDEFLILYRDDDFATMCSTITWMDENAPHHQVFDAIDNNMASVTTLDRFVVLGLGYVRRAQLLQLAKYAQRPDTWFEETAWPMLRAKAQELMVSAAERGSMELQLAMHLKQEKWWVDDFEASAEPEGGEKRLEEMRVYELLGNLPRKDAKSTWLGARYAAELKKGVQAAQKVSPVQWVNKASFAERLRLVKELLLEVDPTGAVDDLDEDGEEDDPVVEPQSPARPDQPHVLEAPFCDGLVMADGSCKKDSDLTDVTHLMMRGKTTVRTDNNEKYHCCCKKTEKEPANKSARGSHRAKTCELRESTAAADLVGCGALWSGSERWNPSSKLSVRLRSSFGRQAAPASSEDKCLVPLGKLPPFFLCNVWGGSMANDVCLKKDRPDDMHDITAEFDGQKTVTLKNNVTYRCCCMGQGDSRACELKRIGKTLKHCNNLLKGSHSWNSETRNSSTHTCTVPRSHLPLPLLTK